MILLETISKLTSDECGWTDVEFGHKNGSKNSHFDKKIFAEKISGSVLNSGSAKKLNFEDMNETKTL